MKKRGGSYEKEDRRDRRRRASPLGDEHAGRQVDRRGGRRRSCCSAQKKREGLPHRGDRRGGRPASCRGTAGYFHLFIKKRSRTPGIRRVPRSFGPSRSSPRRDGHRRRDKRQDHPDRHRVHRKDLGRNIPGRACRKSVDHAADRFFRDQTLDMRIQGRSGDGKTQRRRDIPRCLRRSRKSGDILRLSDRFAADDTLLLPRRLFRRRSGRYCYSGVIFRSA